jgi:hypothetical protein
MLAIMEYVWRIRDHLKKGSTDYGQLLRLLGDTESRMWDKINKINRMQQQVEHCPYAKREMCEMCRLLLEGGKEER